MTSLCYELFEDALEHINPGQEGEGWDWYRTFFLLTTDLVWEEAHARTS